MIRFTLRCGADHRFEGWFASSEAFESQRAGSTVECPLCGSTDVEKALMAPEPEGFNLAGYLLPGVVVTGLGAMLAWVLTRRTAVAATEAPTPHIHGATPEELAELERALAEDGD